MKQRPSPAALVRESLFYGVLGLVGIVMILPLYWSLTTSVKADQDIIASSVQWLPTHLTFDHYRTVFQAVPFARYLLNSFVLAGAGVLTNLFLGSLAGYAFARMRFRGREALFRTLLASMMVPAVVLMIPQFIILRVFPLAGGNGLTGHGGFGLLNSYWAVILPGASGAFAVFLMRQFFLTLPSELAEAARMDGAGEFLIFWAIYLPLAKPAMATLAILTFQAGWNSFLWPLIVLSDPNMSTVQMGLQAFSYLHSTDYGPLMAGSVLAILPTIAIFAYAQKYMLQGIAFTGVK